MNLSNTIQTATNRFQLLLLGGLATITIFISALRADASILTCSEGLKFQYSYTLFKKSVEQFSNGRFNRWCENGNLFKMERKIAFCERMEPLNIPKINCAEIFELHRNDISDPNILALTFIHNGLDLKGTCGNLQSAGLQIQHPISYSKKETKYINLEVLVYGITDHLIFQDLDGKMTSILTGNFELECSFR
jgi:hypothetical protein